MKARRHRSLLGLPWILLAAATGLPQGHSVLRASSVQLDRPPIALVGFGLSTTEREHPWAIIRDETTREEEIFEPGDTVFKTGKLLRIGRTGVEIMEPQATVLRLSLAGQELAPESNDFDELEGNDIFGEAGHIEQRPALPAMQLSSTLAAGMVAQGALASQGSFHSELVGGEKRWGVRYEQIPAGSLFDTLGVRPGDFVYAINRREVVRESDIFDVENYVQDDNQSAISLRVVREGRPLVLRTLVGD